jgi:hypothetical protein
MKLNSKVTIIYICPVTKKETLTGMNSKAQMKTLWRRKKQLLNILLSEERTNFNVQIPAENVLDITFEAI